jgi:predicted nucleotidyltransferase
LFGSFATGARTGRGDVDVLVEFEEPTYTNFLGPCRDLERLFDPKVEVLAPAGLASIRVRSIADAIRKSVVHG